MNQIGQVIAVDSHFVWLDVARQAACQSCAMKSGCGQRALESLAKNAHTVKVARPGFAVSVGDNLEVSLADEDIVKVSLLMYGIPIISMLLVAAIANSLHSSDLSAILGAVVGFLLGAGLMRIYDRVKGGQLTQQILIKTV